MTYPDFDMNTLGESCSRQSEYRTGAENRQTVPHASSGGTRNWAHWGRKHTHRGQADFDNAA
jgi:hypothetical protein